MQGFRELEFQCRNAFNEAGPYWHAYTSGKDIPNLFETADDMKYCMNLIAMANIEYPSVHIIAFEIMHNHLHFVLACKEEEIDYFFSFIKRKLCRCFSHVAKMKNVFRIYAKAIMDLNTLRNTIAYVHRNGFLADGSYTPFNYPWGTGKYYTQSFRSDGTIKECKDVFLRRAFRGRVPQIPASWEMLDGYVSPRSYCDIAIGERMFRNGQHYFYALSKGVEAYAEIAVDIDDGEFLTDPELIERLRSIVREKFRLKSLHEVTPARKVELANMLHYDFRSSNDQIRRVLGMSQYDVNELFPLSK